MKDAASILTDTSAIILGKKGCFKQLEDIRAVIRLKILLL